MRRYYAHKKCAHIYMAMAEEELAAGSFLAELAKNGATKCRRCEEKVARGEVKVGKVISGDWGLQTRWHHIGCAPLAGLVDVQAVVGVGALSEEQLALLSERRERCMAEGDEDAPLDPDSVVRQSWTQPREPPKELLMPLLPYQKEGLGWLLHQERDSGVCGGILADEMGMGKTIQAVALMLANRPLAGDRAQQKLWREQDQRNEVDASKPRGGTLVVLPVVALGQWQAEIARFTAAGSLRVAVYHGAGRSENVAALCEADVVLTSYKTLELAFRKQSAGAKVNCRICGKKFYAEKLRVHRMYFCGDSAVKTDKQALQQKKRKTEGADEEEDEVDKQKRMIKEKKAKEVRAKGGKRGRAAAIVDDEEDSDADAQKKTVETKPAKADRAKAGKAKGGAAVEEEDGVRARYSRRPVRSAAPKSLKDVSSEEDAPASRGGGRGRRPVKAALGKRGRSEESEESFAEVSSGSDSDEEEEEQASGSEDEEVAKKGPDKKGADKKGEGRGRSVFASRGAPRAEDPELERDIAQALRSAPKAVLSSVHKVSWFRVVLDEAHMIKDRASSSARAVFNLDALHRWCLTGTPLQNRVGELYSLIRFLRVDPFAYYMCKAKECVCKSLHYRFSKGMCEDCGHSAMQHSCHFNKHILNPIKRCGFVDEGRRAMLLLKREVLDHAMLRRTKTSRADDIQLPPRLVRVRAERMDEHEEDFYQALYTQSQAAFNTYVQAGTVLNNYAHIFDILIRLRQAVDHPYLVTHSASSKLSAAASYASASSQFSLCGVCGEEPEGPVRAACGHSFCKQCLLEFMGDEESEDLACPQCNSKLSVDLGGRAKIVVPRGGIMSRIDVSRFQSSSKIEALVQELHAMRLQDPGAKAIVFSQFVSMLDLIEHRLKLAEVGCLKLMGGMSVGARENVLNTFKSDTDTIVLLISLKAGGVALNLTVANYIFLMDPWWNPAAEMQAIDRTHRLGQNKPIYAVRFVAANTVEDRILRLQEKKKLVFDGTVGGDAGAMARLTVDDMRFLFQ